MIDKSLEEGIKKTQHFIEIWNKFHDIFKKMVSQNHVDGSKEKEFLSAKELAGSCYEDLMDSLSVKPIRRFVIGRAVFNVLSFDSVFAMSDEKLELFDKNWDESFVFLKELLDRLERKKRRIGNVNRFAFAMKKKINKFR